MIRKEPKRLPKVFIFLLKVSILIGHVEAILLTGRSD